MPRPFTITTTCAEQTFQLGRIVGRQIKTGTILTLTGDLGSGKTAFVQGLARGLDVPPDYYITSPTYTLVNDYPGRLPFYHVDLYRLATLTDIEEIGLRDIISGNVVTAIEWADRLHKDDLDDHLAVRIQFGNTDIQHGESRQFIFSAYGRSNQILLRDVEKKCKEQIWD
ncbi:MAG: tRNA (adenosine(37)-N6)-threonylcarbamoyltransferase complex ATPase subunit type 1 TsaE [Deltaproteobacteria bacterium]|nr:MAG: tRNA (adenosine(37)-N6)-threonylcarbamoyltransferase complex ATPase subunit type 1 TsaE [Deltaproteobacteria bacterium]